MKIRPILLSISISLVALASCKKSSVSTNSPNYKLTGTWYEFKESVYILKLDSGNRKAYDTTYLSPFGSSDYVQFSAADSITVSAGHYYYNSYHTYYFNNQIPTVIPQSVFTTNYIATAKGEFALNWDPVAETPSGYRICDTIKEVNANTILVRDVEYQMNWDEPYVWDCYYQKSNNAD